MAQICVLAASTAAATSAAASSAAASSSAATYSACHQRHGYRRFLSGPVAASYMPPLLWTFPGAGNTWLRMLLDFSTGYYTGSIYGDPSLLPLLPGEGRCDRAVVAVKAHPTHIDSLDFVPVAGGGALQLNTTRKPQYLKCAELRFNAAILVIRDPYRSIWAEYKRYVNWKEVVANRPAVRASSSCRQALRSQPLHSGALLRACFSEAHFHEHAYHLARSWKHMWYHYGRFKGMRASGARVLELSYEELVQPEKRLPALRAMVGFLRLGALAHVADDALECSFRLADNPHIHRVHGGGSEFTTVYDAYRNASLVCKMWSILRRRAQAAGYGPFGGVSCGGADAKPPRAQIRPGKGKTKT